MRALVTGANGLIGNNLVRVLLREGATVRAMVRPTSDLTYLRDLPVEIVYGDVTKKEDVVGVASNMDFIFHTAMHFAYTGRSAEEMESTARSGTENILRAAEQAGVKRTVVTSSSVIFGYSESPKILDEQSSLAAGISQAPYVAAKILQDEHALSIGSKLGIDVVLVCPTISIGVYGHTLGPSNGMIVAYLNDPWRFTYPGGCNIVSVIDVAYGHLLAAQRGKAGEHYLLGSENLEWRGVHSLIGELSGVKGPQAELNHTLSYLASTADELMAWGGRRSPLSTRAQAAMVGRYYWYSHQKAAALGYSPRPARLALAEAISWLAASSHVSREVRTTLRLHPDVYLARRGAVQSGLSR